MKKEPSLFPAETERIIRPWGEMSVHHKNASIQDSLISSRIITISANMRLSLQLHAKRDEWFRALSEGARIQIGLEGKTYPVPMDDYIRIKAGTVHRLIASEMHTAQIHEIAFGPYDEEDIVRLEDDFGRADRS